MTTRGLGVTVDGPPLHTDLQSFMAGQRTAAEGVFAAIEAQLATTHGLYEHSSRAAMWIVQGRALFAGCCDEAVDEQPDPEP